MRSLESSGAMPGIMAGWQAAHQGEISWAEVCALCLSGRDAANGAASDPHQWSDGEGLQEFKRYAADLDLLANVAAVLQIEGSAP